MLWVCLENLESFKGTKVALKANIILNISSVDSVVAILDDSMKALNDLKSLKGRERRNKNVLV